MVDEKNSSDECWAKFWQYASAYLAQAIIDGQLETQESA